MKEAPTLTKWLFVAFPAMLSTEMRGQGNHLSPLPSYAFVQMYQLDSLAASSSTANYFASLYYSFLQSIERQLAPADSVTSRLVRRFEQVFAGFYIEACEAHQRSHAPELPEWRAYFSHPGLQRIQYYLLGANAHLNGGLSQALTASFSPAEMSSLRDEFRIFKRSLNETYHVVYDAGMIDNRRIRNLDILTLGLSRWAGNYYLYKWRKRQMRLARYFWSGSPRYATLLEKINRKKLKIDRLILSAL